MSPIVNNTSHNQSTKMAFTNTITDIQSILTTQTDIQSILITVTGIQSILLQKTDIQSTKTHIQSTYNNIYAQATAGVLYTDRKKHIAGNI